MYCAMAVEYGEQVGSLVSLQCDSGKVSLALASARSQVWHPNHPIIQPLLDYVKSLHKLFFSAVGIDPTEYLTDGVSNGSR